ncbi:MAG: hypothetical protein JST17_15530 [Bacteroidetes bacterium]|nr:hypothetical protein [Bacteroidota bacterium]MBS1930596.1 hypothetical protein [Bacteroidota bacterium]
MKNSVRKLFAVAILSFAMGTVYSQGKFCNKAPWASEKGYWMVESTVQNPLSHLIRFYNNENELIHSEQLNGVKLNMDKKRTKMKLKKALEAAVYLYGQHEEPAEIKNYVVKILR